LTSPPLLSYSIPPPASLPAIPEALTNWAGGQAEDPPGGGRGAVDAEHLGTVPPDGDHRGQGRSEQAHNLDASHHGGDEVTPEAASRSASASAAGMTAELVRAP
jgi:hypothetical protein